MEHIKIIMRDETPVMRIKTLRRGKMSCVVLWVKTFFIVNFMGEEQHEAEILRHVEALL